MLGNIGHLTLYLRGSCGSGRFVRGVIRAQRCGHQPGDDPITLHHVDAVVEEPLILQPVHHRDQDRSERLDWDVLWESSSHAIA